MLRRSIALGRHASIGSNASLRRSQWRAATATQQKCFVQQRQFADTSKPSTPAKESIKSSDPVFLPGSQSPEAKPGVPPPPGKVVESPNSNPTSPATPTSDSAIIQNVPLTPPPPPPSKVQTAPPTSIPPINASSSSSAATPPSPPPPRPRRRFRTLRLLFYLLITGALTYGGGLFYALRSDNFHDFFTEYIPYGEDAVLYFEERAFQARFPHAKHHSNRLDVRPKDESEKVTIPSRSGLSWKVKEETTQGSDVTQKGRHMSALDANSSKEPSSVVAQQRPEQATRPEKVAAVDQAKGKATPGQSASKSVTEEKPKEKSSPAPPEKATPPPAPPKVEEKPSATPPVAQIPPLTIAHAEEPLVQELVKIVNDLITVVNADSEDASNKYSQPITKAKESLSSVGEKIIALKQAAENDAKGKVEAAHKEFEERARTLISQIDVVRAEETAQFREEFEKAREQLAQNYNEKLKMEIERSHALADAKLKNELMEQAIDLKRQFTSQVEGLVEKERDGRLSRLSDLSNNVSQLQELTSDWNGVIDTNLATQKLQVAVDVVRNTLERAALADERPRPFVHELAALKEVANGDPVVDAAIASINPLAYQRGIPTPSQILDRFRRVASEVRKASLLPEDAGIASHAASLLLSRVMFKKQGLAEGTDVESILTRTETLLEEGRLDDAAREMNTLQGWAKTLSKDWLADVRRVLEVKQALDVIETEARLQCLRVE